MTNFSRLFISLAAWGGLARVLVACDSCAVYIAEGADRPGFTLSVAEQFTRFGTVWQGATKLGNPAGQYLDSSITQFGLAYRRNGPWSVQLTLPYVHRSYRRPAQALIERGTESGPGDAVLSARRRVWGKETAANALALNVVGGVKFPTGNAHPLGDELTEEPAAGNAPVSGIHGHDLARGSGSTDYLLGADAEWRHDRWFVRSQLQYKLRRPGRFGYRFADEASWEVAPGRYVLLTPERSVAVQALWSAEHKGFDTLGGASQEDTGFSARYLGGRITVTLGERFTATASLELPGRRRTTATMVVPDYRLRTALNWRF